MSAGAACPAFTIQGLRGRGARGHGCCGEFSNSPPSNSIFFFFLRNSSYSSPPWSKQAPGCSHSPAWLSPKNPAADPAPRPGLQSPLSPHGSRDLIVLKHSSYHLIFRCPLSLVSDLYICWNTVGYSLCSSDQLGISLGLRGSGFRSHLCCRHLPPVSGFLIFSIII